AAEYDAVTHGVGQILANLVQAGIHLERREHEPAAALLAAARDAARINGRPVIQTMVDTWIARLATAQGDQAGALASLAQVRLAAQAPDLDRAHRHLRTALALASPHRYLATIIEQGPGIAALLHSLPAGPGLEPYVDELSVRAEAAAASSKDPAGLVPGGLL